MTPAVTQIGEGGIRTPGTGINQYNGLANRLLEVVTRGNASTYDDDSPSLTDMLTYISGENPELAMLLKAWSSLPEAARTTILHIVAAEVGRAPAEGETMEE